jgi:hypothetical protein
MRNEEQNRPYWPYLLIVGWLLFSVASAIWIASQWHGL